MVSSSVDSTRPVSKLNEYVHNVTDQTFWGGRLWRSIKTIWKEKGTLTGVATVAGLTLATGYTATYGYLLLEGSYRSLNETYTVLSEEGKLVHEPGDAGGWLSLAIFLSTALGTVLMQCIREGDYLNLKPLCQEWYKETPHGSSISLSVFYSTVNSLLDVLSSESFFSKSMMDRKLKALEIVNQLEEKDLEASSLSPSDLQLDRLLSPNYQHIQTQLNHSLSFSCYLSRLQAGLGHIRKVRGFSGQSIAVINGVAIPIILIGCAFLSVCGEVVLTREVLVERKELLLTGHAGEWPGNIIEALLVAAFLNSRFIVNEGDLVISREVFLQELESLKMNEELHNRLCEIANSELQRLASYCSFSKFPLDYNFEKM